MTTSENAVQQTSANAEGDIKVEEMTPIQSFYSGKCVFITGVTGLVGKVLLEKLLRCCPGIVTAYILMRPKRGKSTEERLDEMFSTDLFKYLREHNPGFRKKVVVIYGDLEKPRFGISDPDIEELQNNVQVVFHSAARVTWNDPLRLGAAHHVIATYTLIKMLHKFKKLEVFIHVSTSYVHRDPDCTVPEYVPKMKVTPKQFLSTLEWLDDDALKAIEPFVLKEKVTCYLFMKSLTENVVVDARGDIPTAIVRPCNVAPTLRDPFPGWCDTYQGMQGLMLAGAKGFLRTLYSFKGLKINVVPVDVVANCLIATAWHVATTKPPDVFVVNCVVDYDRLPLADEVILTQALKRREMYPLVNMYRYPDFTIYYTPVFYYIHAFFDHYIPAVIGDTLLFIFTGRTLMFRLYKRIAFMFRVFVALGRDPWICLMDNYRTVMNRMNEKDSEIFFMYTDEIDWEKYMDDSFLAGRKYLAHEDPSNIPYARKKAKIWWAVTTTLKWFFILFFLYYVGTSLFGEREDVSSTEPPTSPANFAYPAREALSFGTEL